MWASVQRGEQRHIFPFQNSADAAFNSALDYELGVLKIYAEPVLRSVKPIEPEYAEAGRLLAFLANFSPIPAQFVPGNSILEGIHRRERVQVLIARTCRFFSSRTRQPFLGYLHIES